MQFDFLNPGARSLALGSAFVGLADDATSAFTNPAGLVILRFPEVSFEVRGRRLESPFLRGGRLSGQVTNVMIDTIAGPLYGESVASSTGLSYLSFVFPRTKWSVAGYRHEFVRLTQEFEAVGVFQGEGDRELALRADRTLNITAYGFSGAYRVRPKVSIGGGVAVYTFELAANFSRFFSPSFYGAPTFGASTHIGQAEQRGDTTGIGFNVGGLFTLLQSSGPKSRGPDLVQLGVVYRKAASFDFEAFEGSINAPVQRNSTFRAPDAFGAGLAVRMARTATITGEVTWVQYESLKDGYISSQRGTQGNGTFTIDNGIEMHAGFEYVFDAPGSPALRIGAWRDPDHTVRYDLPANPDVIDERFAAYSPRRDALGHFTFGGGVSISRQFEVNFGADLSERTRVISASAVVRFVR